MHHKGQEYLDRKQKDYKTLCFTAFSHGIKILELSLWGPEIEESMKMKNHVFSIAVKNKIKGWKSILSWDLT